MNPYNKFSIIKENEIISLYEKGLTQKEIAIKFNTFNTSIRRILLRNNIPIRTSAEVWDSSPINPFTNNKISEYFLGLLVTDGCITSGTKIKFGLQEGDMELMQAYSKFVDKPITKYFHTKHNKFQYQISFGSKTVAEWLKTQANFINKSNDLEMFIPLTWDILLGAFDGDGGLILLNNNKTLRWFICGASYIFIKQIRDFLVKFGYNPTITRNKSMYYVNIYRKAEIEKLYNDLYKNASVYLRRKHDKMATFLGKPIMKNTLNSGNSSISQP